MAKILCIETATTNCSVAIAGEGEPVIKEDYNNTYSHAEKLHVFIEELLRENSLSPSNLDAVAISKGPGSYTGLRIGVSAAKGLCFSLDIPLISVPTLESLARQVNTKNMAIIPLLDARRMEVYSAVFNAEHQVIRATRAEILEENSFAEFLEKGPVVFIGTGVKKFRPLCTHKNAVFVEDKLPSAKEIAAVALRKFEQKDFEDVAYFEPYYLKDFIAG